MGKDPNQRGACRSRYGHCWGRDCNRQAVCFPQPPPPPRYCACGGVFGAFSPASGHGHRAWSFQLAKRHRRLHRYSYRGNRCGCVQSDLRRPRQPYKFAGRVYGEFRAYRAASTSAGFRYSKRYSRYAADRYWHRGRGGCPGAFPRGGR